MNLLRNWFAPAQATPPADWHERLEQISLLKERLEYQTAHDLLAGWINTAGRSRRQLDRLYLPVLESECGECLFQMGDTRSALEHSSRALGLLEQAGDEEDVIAYLGSRHEYYRYGEQGQQAAGDADRLAELHARAGNDEGARRYRRQADLLRQGEPRNRVVVEIDSGRYELDEVLAGIEGRVRFLFERNKLTLRPSAVKTAGGEQLARRGKFDEALVCFQEAIRLDAQNPQPHLEAACCLMHLARPAEAVREYETTEQLAPGWFHCRSDGWLARQIAAGRYLLEAYLWVHALQEGSLPQQRHHAVLSEGLERFPDLAPLHHLHGLSLRQSSQGLLAEQAFQRGLACCEEPDIRTRLLADLAGTIESPQRRRKILEEAIAISGNPVALAAARIMLAFL